MLTRLRDGMRVRGFFQSERYFAGYEDEVRRLFELRAHARAAFVRRFDGLGEYVAVHVRRGDYLERGWALPAGFYRDALETLAVPELPVVVVTDDPVGVRGELRDLRVARFESNAPIVDLQLLMNARRRSSSARASFSWWGAWLNPTSGVRVVAPRGWLGFSQGIEEPCGVVPERWSPWPPDPFSGARPGRGEGQVELLMGGGDRREVDRVEVNAVTGEQAFVEGLGRACADHDQRGWGGSMCSRR